MKSAYAHLTFKERSELFHTAVEALEETYGVELTEDFSAGYHVLKDTAVTCVECGKQTTDPLKCPDGWRCRALRCFGAYVARGYKAKPNSGDRT